MWLTAPDWACPPEKQDKVQSKPARIEVVEPAATDGPGEVELIYHDESGDSAIIADGRTIVVGDPASGRVRAPDVRRAAEAAAAGQYNRAVQAYRAARADEGHGHGGEDVDERLDRLERRMAEILAHLERRSERTPAAIAVPGGRGLPASVPDAPSTLHRFGPTAGARSGGIAPGVFGSSAGGDIVRLYAIPKAKLAALAELMVRPDVPVRVRVLDNGIEVHGSQLDHQIFKAFVTMIIDSDKTKKRYKISPEKLEILGKLMVRPDVQLRVSVGSDRIEVFGTEAEHHAFKAFIDIIEGRQPETEGIPAISAAPGAPGPYTAPLMYATPLDVELQTTRPIVQTQSVLMSHNAAKQLALLAESNSEFAEQAVDLRSELADLNAELADLDAEMADASTEITRVQGELDRIHSEMEADGLDADERDELRTEFHELNSELVELASHIDDVRTNQVRIGNQRTMLEMQLRNVKSRLESIREQMAIAQDQAVIGSAPTASR
jgi:C4-type Zn-finger protein